MNTSLPEENTGHRERNRGTRNGRGHYDICVKECILSEEEYRVVPTAVICKMFTRNQRRRSGPHFPQGTVSGWEVGRKFTE